MELNQSKSRPAGSTQSQTLSQSILAWAMALGSLWLIGGLHLDGWAHHHLALETFFSPWHAVLYSGYAVTALSVGLAWANGIRHGKNWREALSPAYRTSLIGAILFLVGGLADMTWHTLFGIEKSLEALLSPPHLFLALGGGLLVTGPLRSALYRPGSRRWLDLPALLSATVLVALIGFFTEYVSLWYELTEPGIGGGLTYWMNNAPQGYMVAAILLQTSVLMGAALTLLRRFRLPFGALALLFTLTTALGASIHGTWGLALVALAGGLLADGLVAVLRLNAPDGWQRDSVSRVRLFAFLAPAGLYLLFFGGLSLSGGLDWSLELWGGAVILAGFAGWLLSYAFFQAEGA